MYRSATIVRAFSNAAESSSHTVKGRFQHWRRPVYQAPHVNPLEVGPDFSFSDGRTVYVTSKAQLDHKLDQLRLGKKIVSLLAEVKKMEKIHEDAVEQRSSEQQERERSRPVAKGQNTIR